MQTTTETRHDEVGTAVRKLNLLVTGRDSLARKTLKALAAGGMARKIISCGPERPSRTPRIKHVSLDLENEKIADLVRQEKIDAVIHLDVVASPNRSERFFQHNVIGSMNLMAAAAEGGARKIILRSSTWIYGARYNNPNYIPEIRSVSLAGASPYVRDLGEIERYAGDFLKHFSNVTLTVLRFAPLVAPDGDGPLMRYLHLKPVPVLFGFDPLFQLLHEEDAVSAIRQALEKEVRGPINIAPDGVVPLVKILRRVRCRRVTIPHFLAGLPGKVSPGLETLPFDPAFLRFTTGGDNQRMKDELEWTPSRDTRTVLQSLLPKKP